MGIGSGRGIGNISFSFGQNWIVFDFICSWTDGSVTDGGFVLQKLGAGVLFPGDRGVARTEGGCRGTIISQNSISFGRNWIVFGSACS